MNKKMFPHIIAAAAFAAFIVLGLACASKPSGPPPTFVITSKPVDEGFLQGKKAVILNIKMAARSPVHLMDRQGSGGLFSLIQAGVRIGKAAAFNNRARKFDRINADDLNEALLTMSEIIATTWKEAYNSETVQALYDFSQVKPKISHFNKPDAALKKEIAGICADNDAEFVITIMQQVTHGYMDEQQIQVAGRMMAITHIVSEINVFDKKGDIVIKASAGLPYVGAGITYGYLLSPNNGDDYVKLYIDGFGNILKTILAFDKSASFSIEELLAGIVLHFASIADDDEGDEEE